MNPSTLTKFNRFGKVGKIVITILLIAAVIVALLCAAAAVYTGTLPEDAVKVTVTSQAEFKIDADNFSAVWNYLAGSFSYATSEDPSDMLSDGGSKILPQENTRLKTELTLLENELRFFNQSYSSAVIRSDDSGKIIDAESSPEEYSSSDLLTIFVFAALLAVSIVAALLMLRKLFKVLSVCDSPFCTDFVTKLRAFGYSLLPVAILASVAETLAVRFLSAGKNAGVSVQWGILLAFVVTMCLVTVFRYGVQLQKESDETL